MGMTARPKHLMAKVRGRVLQLLLQSSLGGWARVVSLSHVVLSLKDIVLICAQSEEGKSPKDEWSGFICSMLSLLKTGSVLQTTLQISFGLGKPTYRTPNWLL